MSEVTQLLVAIGEGDAERVELDDFPPVVTPAEDLEELLDLDEALQQFSRVDSDKAELVKLVYFAGLSLAEAADVRGVSRTTAHRHWIYARAWLRDAIVDQQNHE